MSITITITDPTPAQIAALFGVAAASAPPAAAEEKPRRRATGKEEPEPKSEPKSEPKGDSAPSHDDVVEAAKALVAKSSREALADLLAEFNAKNLSGVAEGDRAAFIARCGE